MPVSGRSPAFAACAVALVGLTAATSATATVRLPSRRQSQPARSAAPRSRRPAGYPSLNTTGKALSMPVPLKTNGQQLGEIILKIDPDDTRGSSQGDAGRIAGQTARRRPRWPSCRAVADSGGSVGVPQLQGGGLRRGVRSRPDGAGVRRRRRPAPRRRHLGRRAVGSRGAGRSAATVAPSLFSGYVNLFGGIDHQWGAGPAGELTEPAVQRRVRVPPVEPRDRERRALRRQGRSLQLPDRRPLRRRSRRPAGSGATRAASTTCPTTCCASRSATSRR